MANPSFFEESGDGLTVSVAGARDRNKKSTMACEMCRKRKVKCIFEDPVQLTCTFCAKYSFQCIVNTARKRRGPRPRPKDFKSPIYYTSPVRIPDDESARRDRVSLSSAISDHDEVPESPPQLWNEKSESAFISFLEQLNSMEFDLPVGVNESPEVVRHCLILFFTHINSQQCEFINGAVFLEDLQASKVQSCLINALCSVSARFSNHPSLVTQPRYLSGAAFANAARQQCQLDHPIFRLYIIQTLALLALYSFSVNEGAKAWFDLGAANRIAQIISLKVDHDAARPPGIAEVSHRELEAFLQIAKALYVMERLFISGTPSRPVMIAEMDFFHDVDTKGLQVSDPSNQTVNSPVEDPLRMSDESPHIIQLLSIWEHISLFEREGFVNLDPPPWNSQSRFQELRQMLDDWMLRLPNDLQFSSETLALRISEGKGAQLVFLHCLYHHCSMILNRVFLPILPWRQEFRGAPIFFLKERQNKCINSAASISIIIEEAMRSKSFILPPFMGYCVFQSSIVHIHQSFCTTGETAADVKRDLKINLQVLLVAKEFYKPAETWCQIIREMYEVHLEWQTRVCPMGTSALNRQFRRYFDRFEGRIREPPYAVYDDLAYTQGVPPERQPSPKSERKPMESSAGGMIVGPNLDEYRERLRGFAMDLGGEEGDTEMQGVTFSEETHDLGQLYNFAMLTENSPLAGVKAYAEAIDSGAFNTIESFTQGPLDPKTNNATVITPDFEVGVIPSIDSHHSADSGAAAQIPDVLPDFFYEDGGGVFDNFDDLFGDMPDMPDLDGAIDQGFLEFLGTTQH